MPAECLPTTTRKGRFSYTIQQQGGAKIEVLLKAKAFRIVKVAEGFELPATRQRPWFGDLVGAWEWAKTTSGWRSPGC